ncbi:MAG: glycogen synthase [Verrucomicrobiales bacterium]|nr:glycogen synthase [Verrucomicrobiales bacterium]
MKSLLLTNEYPPNVYGGAGIHVQYLARELARLCEVEVRCFGEQWEEGGNGRPAVRGAGWDRSGYTAPAPLHSIFGALQRCLEFNTREIRADVVHLHTWYAHFGGIVARQCYGVPMVLTVHSLEPLRPWKREQLGGGYDFTVWLEKTAIEMADAVIAVSAETKADILRLFDVPEERVHVIYNGIDLDEYRPRLHPERIASYGIDPERPYVLFVGRITRQKGIVHLVNAIEHLTPGTQVVLCAGAPDTPEIAAEMSAAVERARAAHSGPVVWIEQMLDTETKIHLYSGASVFCCPSIYEPFGIINLEAMACEVPVVASAVGGMKEVIVHEETGLLIPLEQQTESPFEPIDPPAFARDLAAGINRLMAEPDTRRRMGLAGRARVEQQFSWTSIAERTLALYRTLVNKS